MDFGKLPSVEGVDFSLPAEPERNAVVLARAASHDFPKTIYLGATGYNMKAWVGQWYPPGAKEKDFLRHYGAQFNTIEHNTTHYRIPDAATVARWREETPSDFRFCPKVPQTVSHARDLGLNGGAMELFCAEINGLAEKMGCCFLQLPPHFGPKELPLLMRFLERFAPLIPLAVEFRHPECFGEGPGADDCFALLEDLGVATVITDVAGRRDVCHMRLSSTQVLIRFVGNALHPSDYSRVQAWAPRLQAWFQAGLRSAYCFTHEPDNLLAPVLAAFCADTFGARMPDVALRGPRPVGGQQGSLF